jgi:N utilization substance protein A
VESLKLLESDPLYADLAKAEAETILQVQNTLTKKAENRPIPPEEFQVLSRFVDRVQRAVIMERDAARKILRSKLEVIREHVPPAAYETPLEEIGLSSRVLNLLLEADYRFAGNVMEQLELDEDKILGLQGFGPKSMEELRASLDAYEFPEVEIVEVPEAEAALEEKEAVAEEVELEEAVVEEPTVEEEVPVVEAVEMEEEPALVAEAEELVPEAAVEVSDEVEEGIPEAEVTEKEAPEPAAVELEDDLEKVFAGFAQNLGIKYEEEDEEEGEIVFVEEDEEEFEPQRKSKKRKKRARVVEFDPDLGETVVRRRRKRGGEGEWEEYDS